MIDDRPAVVRAAKGGGSGSSKGGGGSGGSANRSSSYPSASELSKRLGVDQNEFHRGIKPQIVRDFAPELKGIRSTNPDIGLDPGGNIVLRNPQTGAEAFTDVPSAHMGTRP